MNKDQFIIPQYEPQFGETEERALTNYMKGGNWITEHKLTRKFEDMVCDTVGSRYCFAVNNGTIALAIALKAVGVEAGDEVIVPDLTMIATATAVSFIGAVPVFVDVHVLSLCLDYQVVESYITDKTKAIIYVSLNGRAGEIEEIRKICDKRNIALVEDAAQSFGSFYKEKALGTFGDVGCYSLSTQKIISTGQGGLIVTDNPKIATNVRRLKDFGRDADGSDDHVGFGINAKFTDIQAVIGITQMWKLSNRVEMKRNIYQSYYRELSYLEDVTMLPADSEYTPWFMDIYVEEPDKLQCYLKEKNIMARRVYKPLHLQPYYNENKGIEYRRIEYKETMTLSAVSIYYSERGLWLPSSVTLKRRHIETVCNTVKEYYQRR